MGVTLRFTVEDIATRMETYDVIRVYRATSLTGSYTVQDTVALVADTYHYSWEDTTGTLNHWYKYSFYATVGAAESTLSDPFRVAGASRLRIRQAALSRYGAGIVLVNTGTDQNKITTVDYRFATSFYKANRGRGQWLYVAVSANNAGKARIISASDPTLGTITVLPSFGAAFANNDEAEWHTLVDPDQWNDAINRGLSRYWYVERVPIVCIANQNEYSLVSLPWLFDRKQIHDVRWFPVSSVEIDESYVGDGRWYGTRQDGDVVTLAISPVQVAGTVLYLECTRPMPALYADAAALPNVAVEELAAALAYDEVLKHLSSPGVGTAQERVSWKVARRDHRPELRRLLKEHRPKPRHGPAQTPWPPVAHRPFKSRG